MSKQAAKNAAKPSPWSATPDEVRRRFLDYFAAHGHVEVPSAPLVPENDPTLLFTGAGMNPFKDHFLGRVPLAFRRAASSQVCLRTGDLENVGRTPGHHTLFEMLGNFSFGDYFKEEAILRAWEFLTVEMAIPADRLRVTVYDGDEEAAALWTKVAGIPGGRIGRLGARSNFWPSNAPEDGPDGPCGPCSEVFFDLGFRPGPAAPCSVAGCPEAPESPDCDCRRFLEVWNLVFQQFDRRGPGNLPPLASRNIDTGMGFERLLTVLAHLAAPGERIHSNFETALFRGLVDRGRAGAARSGKEWTAGDETRARRVADHARAAVFCVAAGVRPSNEGRGYVLRRVIRRAVRDLIQLGHPAAPLLHTYVGPVGEAMGRAYPDIPAHADAIAGVLRAEEERFLATYAAGDQLLARKGRELREAGATVFPGEDLFELYDTHGFPVDLAVDFLRDVGLEPDLSGFEEWMEERRRRSREGSKLAGDIFAAGPLERLKRDVPGTTFLGYGPVPEGSDGSYRWHPGVEGASTVVELLRGGEGDALHPADGLAAGEEGVVVLRETPFYAEAGGQVGDAGTIRTPGGLFRVEDTRKVEAFHLHFGRVAEGELRRGEEAEARVDRERRDAVRRNHTATHLLHRVLREVLGEEARQAGSLVAPDHLRFDFSFPRALTPEERDRVEEEVNRRVLANHPVETRVHSPEEARATGAVSMFGEKYGDRVRVLTAGDSREFCGGTHCRATGDIGSFRIVAERSTGSGVRRIEAVTGEGAVRAFQEERRRAAALAAEVDALKKEVRKAGERAGTPVPVQTFATWDQFAAEGLVRTVGRFEAAVRGVEGWTEDALASQGDRVKADPGPPRVLLLHSRTGEGVLLLAAGNPAAVKAGFKAGAAVAAAAKALGGGGGGRPDLARGKGSDPAALPEALRAFEALLAGL